MAKVDETYTLRVGANEYPVSRKGTECTIVVPQDFFSPRLAKEHRNTWVTRVARSFYLDLNKISRVRNASFAIPVKVIVKMEQENNWGNIQLAVEQAFRAHLQRKANGDYGS